jgi:hypothetical protein
VYAKRLPEDNADAAGAIFDVALCDVANPTGGKFRVAGNDCDPGPRVFSRENIAHRARDIELLPIDGPG